MADPKLHPLDATQESFAAAASGADVEHDLLTQNRTQTQTSRGRATWIAPQGKRRDATPYMHVRYNMTQQADILGDPEKMLTDDWKREHIGWKYQWPIRESDETASLIRAGWFKPVPFDAIAEGCPFAMVSEISTPKGNYVVWKRHLLVAVAPQYWQRLVDVYEAYAIQRTVTSGRIAEDELNQAFAKGGYRAEVSEFSDQRQQGITDIERTK